MTKRIEVLPWRSPLEDAYAEVVMVAEVAIRQKCTYCQYKGTQCCDGCVLDALKQAVEKVKEEEKKRQAGDGRG